MADFAAGKWNLVETKNFDDYMKAVGVGLVTRKMANLAKPTQEISVDGNKWNIKTVSTFKTTDVTFTIGEEFPETTGDGRQVKSTASLEGQKLTIQQFGDTSSVIIRTYNGNEMVMTLTAKDVTCERKYKKEETAEK